jgi:hypothetical protein
MSKFMLSMGLVLSSLVGLAAVGYGAPPAAVVKGEVEMEAAAMEPNDGPFLNYDDAVQDAEVRRAQGFDLYIGQDADGWWWVYLDE